MCNMNGAAWISCVKGFTSSVTPGTEVHWTLIKFEDSPGESCGKSDGLGFHMGAFPVPTLHLTSKKNNTKKWAFESRHCFSTVVPEWVYKRERDRDQKIRDKRSVKVLLAHQQAETNYCRGERAKVSVRKWKEPIQSSFSVSRTVIDNSPQLRSPVFWISAIRLNGHVWFPANDWIQRSKVCRKLLKNVKPNQCLSVQLGQPDTPQLELTHWNSQPGCSEVEACGNQWA